MAEYSLLEDEALQQHSPTRDASASTIAMAMFFGSIIFTTASLAARLWLTATWIWDGGPMPVSVTAKGAGAASSNASVGSASGAPQSGRSRPLDTNCFASICHLLHHSTVFGLIMLYSYICEHHPPYPHDEKSYDRDEFFFWTIIVVVFAGGHSVKLNEAIRQRNTHTGRTSGVRSEGKESRNVSHSKHGSLRVGDGDLCSQKSDDTSTATGDTGFSQHTVAPAPSPDVEVLNRFQTEEWKGWMQLTFLLYHYMHATEVYNGIRVMITCYVWMTGFGNFSFFYITNDYSLPRVLQMLWRLNFLVLFLCLTHGTPYILYYICPLHTYYFLMVYAVMYIGKERNYTKWWIRVKLGVLAPIIFIIWDCDSGLFERIHQIFLGYEPMVGAKMGSMWEWYFRTQLDHWSTFLGMVFALNFPIMSMFYRKLEARSKRRRWMGKVAVAAGMLYAFYVWLSGPFLYPKIAYNGTNPYFGFIPLVTYIYLRNLTPTLRSYSMELLHEIGKTTLETYLMQHHIWLTSNSKSVLVFLPGWPRVNMGLVTCIYIMLSRKLHRLTLTLRGILLPDDRTACIKSLSGIALAVAGFYCTAFVFIGMGMKSLPAIGMVSVVCGALLYQAIMDATWSTYRKTVKNVLDGTSNDINDDGQLTAASFSAHSPSSASDDDENESIVAKLCPPIIGTMVLIVLGLIWNGFAVAGAASIGPLPPGCDAFVNDGSWVPIDGCNESSRGIAYRDYGASAFGACFPHGATYVWAWKNKPSNTHCRFSHRDEAMAKKSLNRRKIVFIGDSMTRNLYHASMRVMGIEGSGAYDATLAKHADISNTLWGTTPATFKWAPLAVDQLAALKEINRLSSAGNSFSTFAPDLIVLGGGAWDRLHVYATDEDRKSHAATLKDLAEEMKIARTHGGAAVVWFTPTTINSKALNTEEKRDHMQEEDMEAMRAVYARNGILASSSFVIDGPAFTASRVSESYDGVHYPPNVYNAGAQILFNAIDWLLPGGGVVDPITPPTIGKMANPMLGMMMFIFVFIGLVCFDGFLGFSYLASIFVKGVMPYDLYEEAFSGLHKTMGLSGADVESAPLRSTADVRRRLVSTQTNTTADVRRPGDVEEEIAALLGSKRLNVELSSHPSR